MRTTSPPHSAIKDYVEEDRWALARSIDILVDELPKFLTYMEQQGFELKCVYPGQGMGAMLFRKMDWKQ